MPVRMALLRLLLCLSLLTNGVGSAAAAVHMARATAAPVSTSDSHASCHDAHGMGARGHEHQVVTSVAPDCCKHPGSGCACTLAATAVLPQSLPVAGLVRADRPAVLVRGRAPPPLPHPIRPPIV